MTRFVQDERIAKVPVLNYIGLVYALFLPSSFIILPLQEPPEVIEETETAVV